MSIKNCIGRAVAAGEMDKVRAERILREYDHAFRSFQDSMGHTQAEIAAARQIVSDARIAAAERRRVTQLQAAASTRNVERMIEHRNIRGASWIRRIILFRSFSTSTVGLGWGLRWACFAS